MWTKSYCVIIQVKSWIQQYFHMVLLFTEVFSTYFYLLSLWMKSLSVTIQMKSLQQYFHMVLLFTEVFSTYFYLLSLWMKSLSVTIQMKSLQQYFHKVLFI